MYSMKDVFFLFSIFFFSEYENERIRKKMFEQKKKNTVKTMRAKKNPAFQIDMVSNKIKFIIVSVVVCQQFFFSQNVFSRQFKKKKKQI